MNISVIGLMLILCCAFSANAETYSWTDEKGVVSFTDDPLLIPSKYRAKARKGEDITIRNPKVQQELKEQAEKALTLESNRPPTVSPPVTIPSPTQQPVIESPKPALDEQEPGRTKSQRIRDNIERREAEEKARQLDEKKQ